MACTRRRRIATSEAIGTLLTITITLIAGSAVWEYVNVQAGASELSYANTVVGTDNFLAENFKVSDISFSTLTAKGGSCTSGHCSIVFWLYNVGLVSDQISQVRLYDNVGQVSILYNFTKTGSGGQFQFVSNYLYDLLSATNTNCKTAADSYENPVITAVAIPVQNARAVILTIPNSPSNCPSFGQTFNGGTTYTLKIVGLYGNIVTQYQTKA